MITIHKKMFTLIGMILFINCTSSFAIVMPPYNPNNPYNPINNNPPSSIEDMIAQLQMQQQQLNEQLSQINQAINSLQSYISAQKSLGIKWVDAANGNYPTNTFTVFTNNNHAYHICHAEFMQGTHPGIIKNAGCLITYGGSSLIEPNYQVLTGQLNAQWLTVVNPTIDNTFNPDAIVFGGTNALNINNSNANPSQINIPTLSSSQKNLIAVQGGFEKGSPLYICRAQYNNDSYIGKTVADNCNFAVGSAEVYVKNFQVLVAESRN